MKRVVTAVVALGVLATLASLRLPAVLAVDAPAERIVVMYFHRTQRCPTCMKMGSYSEEAVKSGFAEELKQGKVEFHYIDFQDEKNEALTKGYKVGGPTLMVARVASGKVAEYKNLTDIWAKVADKKAFIGYVQAKVKDYRK